MIVERLDRFDPLAAADALRALGGLAFLDTASARSRHGRYSTVAADPFAVFEAVDGRAHWNGAPLRAVSVTEALRDRMVAFALPTIEGLPPFQGGAIGFFAYEWGQRLEPLPLAGGPNPAGRLADIRLGFFDVVLAFDHEQGDAWLVSTGLPEEDPTRRRARAKSRAAHFLDALGRPPPARPSRVAIPRGAWRSNFSARSYHDAVRAVVERILRGDIFQANIAQRFAAALPPGFDPWAFYAELRRANPAPFAAYLDAGTHAIASSSPELFLALGGDLVETRPIKGTAPRASNEVEDRRLAERLAASEKDRAENLMIVDLLRNDLSRVCRPGSVRTPLLCAVESYRGVHHLVSVVTGQLRRGVGAVDLLAATFPGGSVTGAPKPEAMKAIAAIEREERGLYCGSIAALGFDGSLASSIAIRTAVFGQGQAVFQAGGGITALSDPDSEYRETLDKAERIFRAFEAGGDGATDSA